MIIRYPKADSGDSGKASDSGETGVTAGKKDGCRCKETSAMTPRELISLMIRDLAFWKKAKKG